ncbi:MAG TPA: urease subunit gamma [Acidimicrobiales bacterium]|nr:urease subunit gamma [Acidimicrobiales bacterium]
MQLTPAERDRLLIASAAAVARRRRERGLALNAPEATALVASAVIEAARDGARLAEAIEAGRRCLRADEVLPGVAEVVPEVQVEAVFDDGTRLAVVPSPFGPPAAAGPGAVEQRAEEFRPVAERHVRVLNTAPVPISVTSHFHFFEANPRLCFDRASAFGMHLAVPAGDAVRFAPGEEREVGLVRVAGARVVVGFAGLVDGPLDEPGALERALERARACGYLDSALQP